MNQNVLLKSCRTSFVILIMLFVACSAYAQKKKARVLFIGNSYTHYNNMPQIVADMAASAGDTLEYAMSAPGGAGWYNHIDPYLTSTIPTMRLLQAGGWDYVVLQEQSLGPASPPQSYYQWCFTYAKFIVDSVRRYNPCAEIIFYMTWGRKNGLPATCPGDPTWPVYCTYLGMDSVIRERYLEMAGFNKASVSPAGAVWRYIRNKFPSIELYEPDESHPSRAGSYAVASSMYTAIFKKSTEPVTYNFSLPPATAANIRSAANKVVYDSLDTWFIGDREIIAGFTHVLKTNLAVQFTNNSSNAGRYQWSFGDGQTSTETNPVHTYATAGIYDVRLIAAGISCSDTAYSRIHATQDPNAGQFLIGPNPATDLLHITSVLFGQDNYRIQLMNSMGQLVYEKQASAAETQTLYVSGLATGIYTVVISTTRRIYHKKILIRR